MKGNLTGTSQTRCLFALVLSMAFFTGQAQQNNTLFFMHSLPEANFVNPAVQIDCGLFIGLPVFSSLHGNYSNSGFTPGDVVTLYTDGTMDRNLDFNTASIRGLNFILTEFHVNLLAIGLRRNDYYFSFTATEKDQSLSLYTGDLVTFILRGDPEFEGTSVKMKGTRVSFNHYREYAFGISKIFTDRLTLGVKAKLLFGKYNFTTGNSSFGMFIEPNTGNIVFDIDGGFNSSMPYSMQNNNPGTYRFYRSGDASTTQQLLNRQNPGVALDFGIIYKYSNRLTFSGSLLDVGMIRYRSNVTNYSLQGSHTYNGPFGASMVTGEYLWDVFDELNLNMTDAVTTNAYTYYLDPKLYLGAAYQMNKYFDLNMLVYNRFLPHRVQTGTTVSLLSRPSETLAASISWSYMNKSFNNLGIGFGFGKNPLQAYLVSDNILGFVAPMSTRNVNLRVGINLILDCKSRFDINQCGCEWLKDAENHRLRKETAKRKK
jgi:hypothetical protein